MKLRILALVLAANAGLFSATANAGGKELNRDAVPQPVLEAFAKAQPSAKVEEYKQKIRNGATVYEIEFKQGGVEHEYYYSANGALLETEAEIKLGDLPNPVVEAIKKAYPGAVLKEANKRSLADGKVSGYEVEVKHSGEELELELDADGNILQSRQD